MSLKRWALPWAAHMLAALPVLAIATPSRAATEAEFAVRTTGDLVDLCDPKSDTPMDNAAVNFCQGFALGAVMVEMEHDAASRSMKLFCLPSPAPTRTETLAAFVKWARASPERLGDPPADGLFRFLGERFPCPSSK